MFPEAPRVVYCKKPSEEVICQLRFPTILRIDAEVPATFQEAIRTEYPNFQDMGNPAFSPGMPPDLSRLLGIEFSFGGGKSYQFVSADNQWAVRLDRDSLSVTTQGYERWEGFRRRFCLPFEALCNIYRPLHFSRIGLRYRDIIRKDKLGLGDVPWSNLLNHQIAAEFASSLLADHIQQAGHKLVIQNPDGKMRILLQHGLAQLNAELGICYFIDSDFFYDKETRVDDALATLDAFRIEARRLFRWCITDQLHRALDPEPA